MDEILTAILSQNANYKTKQLLKAGRLEECLSSALADSRAAFQVSHRISVMLFLALLPIVTLSSFSSHQQGDSYVNVAVLPVLLLAAGRGILFFKKLTAAQTRLETLAVIWRATRPSESPEAHSPADEVLAFFSQW